MAITYGWRGDFTNTEANELHAEAFQTRVFDGLEWDWNRLVAVHSLGWVVARSDDGTLVGFVNVLWDGLVHAFIQDTMVAKHARGQHIGTQLIAAARETRGSRAASGCTSTSTSTCGRSTSTRADSPRRPPA